MISPKPCKLCPTKRYGNSSWCFKHLKARERQIKEDKAKRKLERFKTTKVYMKLTKKRLHAKAWKLISLDVRTDNLKENWIAECYTCGTLRPYKEMDCGHYWHDRLDLDKRNLKVQCDSCNRKRSGNLAIYGARLLREHGEDFMHQLEVDARSTIYQIPDYLRIIDEIKERLKIKGIEI